jgi:hypothetical protein
MTNYPGNLLRSAPRSVRSPFDLRLRLLAAMLTPEVAS